MSHERQEFYDPTCVVCTKMEEARNMHLHEGQHLRQMWQGSSIAVLQTVYNLLIDDEPKAAKQIIKTYLQHLGEWTD
jgi:hypothetical protein